MGYYWLSWVTATQEVTVISRSLYISCVMSYITQIHIFPNHDIDTFKHIYNFLFFLFCPIIYTSHSRVINSSQMVLLPGVVYMKDCLSDVIHN